MSDVEKYAAHVPVSNSLLDDMDPIEFVAEIMRQFRDYARARGYALVHGYLRIEVGAVYAHVGVPESFDFAKKMQLVSVTASCRKVET